MIMIDGENLTIEQVHKVARGYEKVGISDLSYEKMSRSREIVEMLLSQEKPIYGVNTGFGALASVQISKEKLKELQKNIILSHSAGIGEYLREDIVRAMMLIRANALAKGYSGIRPVIVEKLIELLNRKITPAVPEKGSVGASGDLAPLSHIAMALIGHGKVFFDNELVDIVSTEYIPVELEEKEGLSLINGTQFMAAHLALLVRDIEKFIQLATLTAAASVDVLLGTPSAFDERIQMCRPHPGQIKIAQLLRENLDGSELRESHRSCKKVQDPYTLRTIPQVYGAIYDTVSWIREVVTREINSSTDNPLVFDDEIISGGNFHGEPIALCADYLAIALTSMGNMIERRIDRLVNPKINEGLPAFLAAGEEGLNSGYMLWQYTAAALCNENKILSYPASADSIPTSAYQEDHVSMGANAVRKLCKVFENMLSLLAIETMLSKVALEFRRPLKSSKDIENFLSKFDITPSSDKFFGSDFQYVRSIIVEEVSK
ncbi:MAG TPA: histidine ammonia-lyase [Fervidobacterium sp.]|nr:histidine ammonia-lyase [Fervidobacterium sp.]HQE47982.1 histidine ammonia-lyase [Fervidobacterium sp.]HUM41471.1 histidine ammonia-lyase [Fervidobacterium sp.]